MIIVTLILYNAISQCMQILHIHKLNSCITQYLLCNNYKTINIVSILPKNTLNVMRVFTNITIASHKVMDIWLYKVAHILVCSRHICCIRINLRKKMNSTIVIFGLLVSAATMTGTSAQTAKCTPEECLCEAKGKWQNSTITSQSAHSLLNPCCNCVS